MPLLEKFDQKITCLTLLSVAFAFCLQCNAPQTACAQQKTETQQKTDAASDIAAQVKAARAQVATTPNDPKSHYALAQLLKREGRQKEAAEEFLSVTALEPDYYLAYHQLSSINADPNQLDEAVTRLSGLEDERPKDLMLRVALSEVLEKQGNYYRAARTLVDLLYNGSVPDKYRTKIDTRVHFLLSKAQHNESNEKSPVIEDDEDSLPPALPDSLRPLSAAKQSDNLNNNQTTKGPGHAPLLP